jgi:hypothetical protein
MSKLDPRYVRLHKEVYCKALDELDSTTIAIILANPKSDEAILLENKVEARIQERLIAENV